MKQQCTCTKNKLIPPLLGNILLKQMGPSDPSHSQLLALKTSSSGAQTLPFNQTVGLEEDLPHADLTPEGLSCLPCPLLMVFSTLAIL